MKKALSFPQIESAFRSQLKDHHKSLQERLETLQATREQVVNELQVIEEEMTKVTILEEAHSKSFEQSPAARKGKTANQNTSQKVSRKKPVPLKSAIHEVLNGSEKPLKAREIADQIESRNIPVRTKKGQIARQIGTLLFRGVEGGEFKKVDRGLYQIA